MQYREIESSPRSDRAPRRVMMTNLENGNGEVEWADEDSDLDPSYDPDDSDSSGITLGSQDTDESDESDSSDDSDLSGFIVDDDCIEFYSTDDDDDDDEDDEDDEDDD